MPAVPTHLEAPQERRPLPREPTQLAGSGKGVGRPQLAAPAAWDADLVDDDWECPECAELNDADADVCRWCGEDR